LRIQARRAVLRSVGRSLVEGNPVWEVLREHTHSFDGILAQALYAAEAPRGFALFAVGRLGTCELDVLSDADLLFVRSPECDPELAGRCAQAVVGMLSGYTREGWVIEVDTRIRPHGTEGALVSSLRQLAQYFEGDAKAWEVLAFSKLRWIAGDRRLEAEVCEAVAGLRRRFAGSAQFVPELCVMRKRIADSYGPDSFKGGPGALYDLDFILGLLEARHGLPAAALQIPERLAALGERELLTDAQCGELLDAACLFRTLEHAIRVVEGRPRKWIPESDALRGGVERLLKISELDGVVRGRMRRVRGIFDSLLGD
jgi:[glutamine synthetase] adenylyltransferase / [glutamine synthetase]-adenylyl-L-tyrosine phosphorylase